MQRHLLNLHATLQLEQQQQVSSPVDDGSGKAEVFTSDYVDVIAKLEQEVASLKKQQQQQRSPKSTSDVDVTVSSSGGGLAQLQAQKQKQSQSSAAVDPAMRVYTAEEMAAKVCALEKQQAQLGQALVQGFAETERRFEELP